MNSGLKDSKSLDPKINETLSEFEKRLESIILSQKEKDKITTENVSDTLIEVALKPLGFLGDAINEILTLGKKLEEDIYNRKTKYLLAAYFKDTEDLKEELVSLKNFLSNPYGSMLYFKIIEILNENSPNPHFIKMLSKALRKVVNTDFESLFEEHKYVLDLIGRLSPQALIILADCPQWPPYQIGNYSSDKGIITSEWVGEYAKAYGIAKNILNPLTIRRLSHAVNEHLRLDLIRSMIPNSTDSKDFGSVKKSPTNAICVPTDLGEEVLTYIDPVAFNKWKDKEYGKR